MAARHKEEPRITRKEDTEYTERCGKAWLIEGSFVNCSGLVKIGIDLQRPLELRGCFTQEQASCDRAKTELPGRFQSPRGKQPPSTIVSPSDSLKKEAARDRTASLFCDRCSYLVCYDRCSCGLLELGRPFTDSCAQKLNFIGRVVRCAKRVVQLLVRKPR